MKKSACLFTCGLLLAGLFMACSLIGRDRDLSISVTDSKEIYMVKADYAKSKTWKLYKHINKKVRPGSLFASPDDYMDFNTVLPDDTRIHVKASPGKLRLKLNKKENSQKSYEKMKSIGEGIKDVLAD